MSGTHPTHWRLFLWPPLVVSALLFVLPQAAFIWLSVHEDRGLIRYLMRHHHTTPFEMCEIKLHVRVPMDTWRQWIRHRTASVNEYSTRYSIAIDEALTTQPNEWRLQRAPSDDRGRELPRITCSTFLVGDIPSKPSYRSRNGVVFSSGWRRRLRGFPRSLASRCSRSCLNWYSRATRWRPSPV